MEHAVLLDRQMEELESRIEQKLQPYREQYELLQTIPGVKEMTAATILAEIGPDMSQFETAKHLCSWAGISPGNNQSAGKGKHSRIKKGSKFLLSALVEAAWAAARKRGSIFQRKFQRWMRKLGQAKANVALARNLLEVVYVLLKERQPYREPDPKQMHELEKAKLVRHHAKRLRQLGADNDVVNELVASLSQPAVSSSVEENETTTEVLQQPVRKVCPAKVCRGALGFALAKHASTNTPSEANELMKPLHLNRLKPNKRKNRRRTTKVECDSRSGSYFRGKDLHGCRLS